MIISMISAVTGMVGGLLPDIFKEIRESREHTREIERMDKTAAIQLEMVKAKTDAKLQEVKIESEAAEVKGYLEQMRAIVEAQAKPTGIKWVDAFNALLRPSTALMIMILFVATSGMYVWTVLSQVLTGTMKMDAAAVIIWGSLVGESIQAVLGFLFGYRSTKGRVSK
jgi:hypothetical protein